ncbi:uncharacterized protein E2C01_022643 [Portunus trituberculatus]|uniref:RNA-directed DNA polymerase n=1 Tax=Portunus trituberculatus TaxID=210409 RepID=A0A5B7E5X6_PORTR|nr:uncharacterized protein [Portunus trituberculatus]
MFGTVLNEGCRVDNAESQNLNVPSSRYGYRDEVVDETVIHFKEFIEEQARREHELKVMELKLRMEKEIEIERERIKLEYYKIDKGVVHTPSGRPVHFVRGLVQDPSLSKVPVVPAEDLFSTSSKPVDVSEEVNDADHENSTVSGVVQAVTADATSASYSPYLYSGLVKVKSSQHLVRILRDTGSSISLWVRPDHSDISTTEYVLIKVVTGAMTVPLLSCKIDCEVFRGPARVGIVDSLLEDGVDLLLGNNLVRGDEIKAPILSEVPVPADDVKEDCGDLRMKSLPDSSLKDTDPHDNDVHLADTFIGSLEDSPPVSLEEVDMERFRRIQREDPEIEKLCVTAAENLEEEKGTCLYLRDGIPWRRWRPLHRNPDSGMWDVHQLVVPKVCWEELLNLPHTIPFSGHMGIRKTLDRLRAELFWPCMAADVANIIKCCHTCQVVGNPNQTIPKFPLIPIPAIEPPFSRLIMDVVGPLPPTSSGFQYILTILDLSTRYPEAIPFRYIKARGIIKALLDFCSKYGLPKEIQTDQGSNFMSNIFQQALSQIGVTHIRSSAYHPESQGALERYHNTLKNMLRKYCQEHTKDWDRGLPLLLFATREVPQESLGFSANELVFAHTIRGPLSLLKGAWTCEPAESKNLLQYVLDLKTRISEALELAHDNLKLAQGKMKQ